ncbi:MAG TPA: hypothetical protein VHA76_10850 [Solirubrobacterales bacterium]|nr:hypothetical protein [Solirubrobacterales bacterium]
MAKRERVADLLLDNVFERLGVTAPNGTEGGEVRRRSSPRP